VDARTRPIAIPADGLDAAFARSIERAHPVIGPAWLRELPQLQRRLASEWELTLTQWLPARGACVRRAVSVADGDEVVVKIPVIAADTVSEGRALSYWDGDGAPRLRRVDAETGTLLVDWVDGRPFVEQRDTAGALRRAGEYLRELRRPRQAHRPDVPTLEAKLAPLRRSREQQEQACGGVPALDDSMLHGEAEVRTWLADSLGTVDASVIHGDLHPRNLLVRRDGCLSAIDPYGVVGDPCRDAASLALFFREDDKALCRLEALADFAAVDRDRVVAHAYAIAVGSYRFRVAYGVSAGLEFLQEVMTDLQRRLSGVVG
jgi:streptomycin 6-kinase